MKIKVLPYKGKTLTEIRPSYFLKAFGEDIFDMRIFSFGKCNYSCPYCKRDGYDKNNNEIDGAVDISEEEIFLAVDDAIKRNQVVRLSGGDPVCYPGLAIRIAKYVKQKGGIVSIAHNGSGPEFVEKIAPYLDFASIDFKAPSYKQLGEIAGIDEKLARTSFANTIRTIRNLQKAKVYTDVRTCIFEDSTVEQLDQIAKLIQGDEKNEKLFWTLRTYSQIDGFDKKPKSSEEMNLLALELSKRNPELRIGLRDKWEPGGFKYYYGGKRIEEFPNGKKKIGFEKKEQEYV